MTVGQGAGSRPSVQRDYSSVDVRPVIATRALPGLLILLLAPPPAVASAMDYRLEATLSAGVTDNALAVPAGEPGAHADVFVLGRAGAALLFNLPNAEHRLAYALSAQGQRRETTGRMLAHALSWHMLATPTDSLHYNAGVEARYTSTASIETLLPQAAPPPSVAPSGTAVPPAMSSTQPGAPLTFLTGVAGSSMAYVWPEWRLDAGLTGRALIPRVPAHGPPRGLDAEAQLGFARTGILYQVGLMGHAGYSRTAELRMGDMLLVTAHDSRRADAVVAWHQEITRVLASQLEAGALAVRILGRTVVEPSGRAVLTWREGRDEVRLLAGRSAAPNLLVGETLLTDQAALAAAVRWGRWNRMLLSGQLGYEHNRIVSGTGPNAAANVLTGRASLAYDTERGVVFALEGGYTDQRATGPRPEPGQYRPLVSFRRTVVMLTVEFQYPNVPQTDREIP
jgi:hypothetical protein